MHEIPEDDRCELDPHKVCDNCFRCLEPQPGQDYAKIEIAAVYTDEDYLLEETAGNHDGNLRRAPASVKLSAHTLTGLKSEKRRV